MSQSNTWGPDEDALSQIRGELAQESLRFFIHGHPQQTRQDTGDGHGKMTLFPDQVVRGHTTYSTSHARIRTYDNDTHARIHRDTDGNIIHYMADHGVHYQSGEWVHSAFGIAENGDLTPPYWKRLFNEDPLLPDPHTHEELHFNPGPDPEDEYLSAWHAPESHGLQFPDTTHYQFNPAATITTGGTPMDFTGNLDFPSGHSVRTVAAVGMDPAHMQIYDNADNLIAEFPGGGGGGGFGAFTWVIKTANYTITTGDSGILIDATSNDVTITLPSAVGITQKFTVKRYDSSSHIAIVNTTSSQTIDGAANAHLPTQNMSYDFGGDNANWFIASAYYPSPLTTKGDVIVANSDALPQRLGVGSNTQQLTADSTQTLGVKWDAA